MKKNSLSHLLSIALLCSSFVIWNSFADEETTKLKILNPIELRNEFAQLKDITVAVANFGNVPWGRTVRGSLYQTDPFDACATLKPIDFQAGAKSSNSSVEAESPMLVSGRGNCTFVMKALNAQNAGAKLLIVIDDKEENENFVLPVDDGHGGALHIPVLLINNKTGELINKYLDGKESVSMTIKFEMPKTYNEINYEIWLSSSDGFSFDLIKDIHKYQDILGKKAKMTPHYAIWFCPICELLGYKTLTNPNCVSGGRYCSPDPDGNGPLTGKDTLLEDLRQLCIYKQDPTLWWEYHDNFRKSCLNAGALENCSYATMDDIKVDKTIVQKCVNDSFVKNKNETDFDHDDNTILKEERALFMQRGILTWPAVVINGMTYRGNLEPASYIFEAMCGGFTVQPAECDQSSPKKPDQITVNPRRQRKSHLLSILLIISLATLAFIVLFFCYKRHMKREILNEMNTQISSTMHRYMAMRDDKDTSSEEKKTVFAIDDA